MAEIELYMGSTKAVVSTNGGYVTNLADETGDVLYPKRTLKNAAGEEKTRGGCHVCMPNFGPGGDSGLAQHGYGRMSEWQIIEQSENAADFALSGEGAYAAMDATLHYEVLDRMFEMTLTLKNLGDTDLAVAPGFHPYFFRGKHTPEIDDEVYENLDELEGTKFIDGPRHELILGDRSLRLTSEELTTWAVWTDQLGDYVCVEPTYAGYAFIGDDSQTQTLRAGEHRTYTTTIVW